MRHASLERPFLYASALKLGYSPVAHVVSSPSVQQTHGHVLNPTLTHMCSYSDDADGEFYITDTNKSWPSSLTSQSPDHCSKQSTLDLVCTLFISLTIGRSRVSLELTLDGGLSGRQALLRSAGRLLEQCTHTDRTHRAKDRVLVFSTVCFGRLFFLFSGELQQQVRCLSFCICCRTSSTQRRALQCTSHTRPAAQCWLTSPHIPLLLPTGCTHAHINFDI
jgi:hypothetical protein